MSRSHHPRPPKPTGDAASRVSNAARGVADAVIRFEREFARLQRALADGRADGVSDIDLAASVNVAGHGRPDRREALRTIQQRLATARAESGPHTTPHTAGASDRTRAAVHTGGAR